VTQEISQNQLKNWGMGGVRFCIARRILGMHAILRRGRGLVTGKKSLGSIREMPDGEIRTRISGALLGTSDGVIPPHLSRAREAFVGLGADGHFCPPPSARSCLPAGCLRFPVLGHRWRDRVIGSSQRSADDMFQNRASLPHRPKLM
jgi:hypothetical protein